MVRSLLVSAAAAILVAHAPLPAGAETLHGALSTAYANNPSLNAARAELRATDEGVPQALSSFRPSLGAAIDGGLTSTRGPGGYATTRRAGVSLTLEQPLFTGFRAANGLRAAETAVLAGREILRNEEQLVLLDAVTAYMDVVRDRAVLGLNAQNVEFLQAEVRASEDRLSVGEGTRTDVAQANARLRAAESQLALSRASLTASEASYLQVIGRLPDGLSAAAPIDRLVPRTQQEAVSAALSGHPAVMAAQFNADIAALNVEIAEGALLPTVSVTGSLSRSVTPDGQVPWSNSASIGGRISIPIYGGGGPSSEIRQAKERLGQRRIEVDVSRAQVQALALSSFGQLSATRAQVAAAEALVAAAQLALEGLQEERRVGQRTLLDVLNAQQEVLSGRISLVRAQRDRVVTSYTLLSATGRLSAATLGLSVSTYVPAEHYEAVRDLWFGLRTPDGR